MESIESSETSAYINTLTPGTYPKEKKLQFLVLVSVRDWFDPSAILQPERLSMKIPMNLRPSGLQSSASTNCATENHHSATYKFTHIWKSEIKHIIYV